MLIVNCDNCARPEEVEDKGLIVLSAVLLAGAGYGNAKERSSEPLRYEITQLPSLVAGPAPASASTIAAG
jgi:hypothetical protein